MGRDWLRKIRNEKDMTHEEVATLVKISRQYYGMIESEVRDPGVSLAKRIGAVLEFDWTLFFKHKGNETLHSDESRTKEAI
ncbi:helix-turn-helix transcriptional regulator [Paenibacillus thiaminolyticus]